MQILYPDGPSGKANITVQEFVKKGGRQAFDFTIPAASTSDKHYVSVA